MTSESSRQTPLLNRRARYKTPRSVLQLIRLDFLIDPSLFYFSEMISLTAENSSTSVNQTKRDERESEKFFGTN